MKKLISVLIVVAMVFMLSIPALANPGQNPNQNPGSPAINIADTNLRITVTGGGNNLVIRAIDLTGEFNDIIIPRTGNGTFNQAFGPIFGGFAGRIFVQGNSLLRVELTAVPYVCGNLCADCEDCFDCSDAVLCECDDYEGLCEVCCPCGEFAGIPTPVNLGFIGYYVFDGKVMSTSIHWQFLNEDGDMIDWDAVDAAYAAWIAQGGLAPCRSVWQTSGFASFTFEDYAALGFGDFNDGQLEAYYLAYYVDPGYLLPYVCGNICEGCDVCLDCGECECVDAYECECSCSLVCRGGNGNCVPCDSFCEKDGGCDCKCACTLWAGKGCQNCQGNSNANRRCDGSGCDGNGRGPNGGGNQQ